MKLRYKLLSGCIGIVYVFFVITLFGSMVVIEYNQALGIITFIGSLFALITMNHYLMIYFHKLNTEPEE